MRNSMLIGQANFLIGFSNFQWRNSISEVTRKRVENESGSLSLTNHLFCVNTLASASKVQPSGAATDRTTCRHLGF